MPAAIQAIIKNHKRSGVAAPFGKFAGVMKCHPVQADLCLAEAMYSGNHDAGAHGKALPGIRTVYSA